LNYRHIDWSSSSAPSVNEGSSFIDILNDFHLHQLVDSPTRFCRTTSSLLDLVICSHPGIVSEVSIGREFSDHCMILFNISLAASAHSPPARKIYLYNYNQMRTDLRSFGTVFFSSLHENWLSFKQAVSDSVEKNVPSRLVHGRNRRPPWLTPTVCHAIRKRDALSKIAKKSNSPIDRDRYRKARNLAANAMKLQYQNHLNAVIGDVKNNPRAFNRFIKSKRSDPFGIPPIRHNGKVLTEDNLKANCLSDYFASVFTADNHDDIPHLHNTYPSMPNITSYTSGVLKLLSGIQVDKSTGPDMLAPRVLKELCNEIAAVLTFIFNQSLTSGVVPAD